MGTKNDTTQQPPFFTVAQLRIIHHDLFFGSWQSEYGYDERRDILRALDTFFGADRRHLERK